MNTKEINREVYPFLRLSSKIASSKKNGWDVREIVDVLKVKGWDVREIVDMNPCGCWCTRTISFCRDGCTCWFVWKDVKGGREQRTHVFWRPLSKQQLEESKLVNVASSFNGRDIKVRQGHGAEVAVDQEQTTQRLDIFLVLEFLQDELDAFRREGRERHCDDLS